MSDALGNDPGDGLECCPGAFAKCPAALEVVRARRWWEKNPSSLEMLYPDGVPAVVIVAVECAEGSRLRWESDRAEVRRRDSETKNPR